MAVNTGPNTVLVWFECLQKHFVRFSSFSSDTLQLVKIYLDIFDICTFFTTTNLFTFLVQYPMTLKRMIVFVMKFDTKIQFKYIYIQHILLLVSSER